MYINPYELLFPHSYICAEFVLATYICVLDFHVYCTGSISLSLHTPQYLHVCMEQN